MKILLINNNPVVSRLTALSARKEDIEIDEIQEVMELNSDTYDIVFVDADSLTKDVRDVISENIKTQKSVLFYGEGDGDEEEKSFFDLSILKPFLPSEVSAVIRSIEEKTENSTATLSKEENFNILDDKKVDSRDKLFDLDGLDVVEEKKEELALTVDENIDLELKDISFDDKLEEAFPLKVNTLDDDLFDDKLSIEKSKEKENTDIFDLDLSDEIPSLEDDLFAEDKKEKTVSSEAVDDLKLDLDDDLLELTSGKTEELVLPEDKEEKTVSSEVVDDLKLDLDDDLLELTSGRTEDLALEEDKKEKTVASEVADELKLDLDDDLLEITSGTTEDLALEVDEPVLEEVKKETQILDELEIENIKGLLVEDNSDDMTLEDLMPAMGMMATDSKPKLEEKKEKKASDVLNIASSDALNLDSNVLAQTLAAMPVENLRQLLAGAKVNIKIKFPKSK